MKRPELHAVESQACSKPRGYLLARTVEVNLMYKGAMSIQISRRSKCADTLREQSLCGLVSDMNGGFPTLQGVTPPNIQGTK